MQRKRREDPLRSPGGVCVHYHHSMSKVIVITGASGGIGAALAERLARDGNPVSEVLTNAAQIPVARAYAEEVAAFEANLASGRPR